MIFLSMYRKRSSSIRIIAILVAVASALPLQTANADDSRQKLNNAFRMMREGRNEEALALAGSVPESRCNFDEKLLRLEILAITKNELKRFSDAIIDFDINIAMREELIATLKRKNKQPSEDEVLQLSMAYTHKAKSLYMLRRLKESLSCLEIALVLRPNNGSAQSDRAKVLMNLGRSREAVEAFSKLLASLRTEVQSSNNASRVYSTRAAVIQCLYNRALAYKDLGMMEQSKRDRDEADRLTREL